MADADTLASYFHQWRGRIRGWLCRMTDDIDLVNDIEGEMYLRAWNAWHNTKPDDIGAWLFTIARNLLWDHLRRQISRKEREDRYEWRHRTHNWNAIDALLDVERAWPRLTQEQQDALILAALGYTGAAGAERMGINPIAFNSVVHRGRQTLMRLTR